MKCLREISARFLLLATLGFWLAGPMPAAHAYQSSESAKAPALAYQTRADIARGPAGEITLDQLPAEARHTLELIKKGGPFPYSGDGISFGNRERILPRRERSYYHEYTYTRRQESRRAAHHRRGARGVLLYGRPLPVFRTN